MSDRKKECERCDQILDQRAVRNFRTLRTLPVAYDGLVNRALDSQPKGSEF